MPDQAGGNGPDEPVKPKLTRRSPRFSAADVMDSVERMAWIIGDRPTSRPIDPPPVGTSGARISVATKEQILARLQEYEDEHPKATSIPELLRCLLKNKKVTVSGLLREKVHRSGTTNKSVERNVRRARAEIRGIPVKIHERGKGKKKTFWLEEFPPLPR